MITFKSHSDLDKLPADSPARPIMADLVQRLIDDYSMPDRTYSPDDDGYVVLVEPGDTGRVLDDIDMPWRLADVPWEGASKRDGYIFAIYLGTDDYGMAFVIPDAEWVDGELRAVLEEILD